MNAVFVEEFNNIGGEIRFSKHAFLCIFFLNYRRFRDEICFIFALNSVYIVA